MAKFHSIFFLTSDFISLEISIFTFQFLKHCKKVARTGGYILLSPPLPSSIAELLYPRITPKITGRHQVPLPSKSQAGLRTSGSPAWPVCSQVQKNVTPMQYHPPALCPVFSRCPDDTLCSDWPGQVYTGSPHCIMGPALQPPYLQKEPSVFPYSAWPGHFGERLPRLVGSRSAYRWLTAATSLRASWRLVTQRCSL